MLQHLRNSRGLVGSRRRRAVCRPCPLSDRAEQHIHGRRVHAWLLLGLRNLHVTWLRLRCVRPLPQRPAVARARSPLGGLSATPAGEQFSLEKSDGQHHKIHEPFTSRLLTARTRQQRDARALRGRGLPAPERTPGSLSCGLATFARHVDHDRAASDRQQLDAAAHDRRLAGSELAGLRDVARRSTP